ncbi:NnrU family protein [Piscinibacter koreensis]|uniref:NnrU family protein n=1 Tax=Piscinibacter koreensis TaxID=2742824 RepID=A0A7Y6NP65_9BURK|nr:NnrU family protein [Schlegelella koreensis]NUZ06716.1 NnrU family protein [Schlegelella koreensis]
MFVLVAGLLLFLGIHSVRIVAPSWRDAQLAARGEGRWKGLYSVVSAIGLVLLIVGYGRARATPVVLYLPPPGLRHLALLLTLPVFPLLVATYARGAIAATVRHPMLAAVLLWALAHLLANGTLADLLLFGAFFVWAFADLMSALRRPAPAAASARWGRNDAIAIGVGLALYAAFAGFAHRWLIGVSPLG